MPDSSRPLRILAFDFGTHKIGVAFGQSVSQTTTALKPLRVRDGIPDWLDIEKLISDWQPDLLVVGIPFNMDDTDNEITVRARKFMRRLHGRFGKPCEGMDERLSSREARVMLQHENDQTTSIDSLAASLILQSWFNQQSR